MEVDGEIVFFNESEAVAAEDDGGNNSEAVPAGNQRRSRENGKKI